MEPTIYSSLLILRWLNYHTRIAITNRAWPLHSRRGQAITIFFTFVCLAKSQPEPTPTWFHVVESNHAHFLHQILYSVSRNQILSRSFNRPRTITPPSVRTEILRSLRCVWIVNNIRNLRVEERVLNSYNYIYLLWSL